LLDHPTIRQRLSFSEANVQTCVQKTTRH